ncbi:hypothetical protein CQA40_03140 [Helicobacter sp. MIT 01-3238]|nr:hypothetical protein CQA40_03140 [Helicobacter sp. MIT 01-3238]
MTEVPTKFCVKNLWQSVSPNITNSKVKQKQNNQHNTIKSQKISKWFCAKKPKISKNLVDFHKNHRKFIKKLCFLKID